MPITSLMVNLLKSRYRNLIMLLTIIICIGLPKANAAQTLPLRIAVASNFAPVLTQLAPLFTEQSGIKMQIISSATGALYQQIVHGAPFDVFMAADAVRPQKLIEQQLAIMASKRTYAKGVIAYWSSSSPQPALKQLMNTDTRLGIANPDIAPYGKAAKQALQHLGVWEQYQHNLIIGININQTFQQIRSKAVKSGIVALSQLKLNGLSGAIIPANYHQPIEQQLVIISASKQQEHAKKFRDFIMSQTIQNRIAQHGYITQDEEVIQ
ncbi:molybdate ABC transporter substrate-binding protein [Colwelliaceae bacterium 6471]